MQLTEKQKNELLAFNNGNPIIVTPSNLSEGYCDFDLTIYVRTISKPTPVYVKSIQMRLSFTSRLQIEQPHTYLLQGQLFHPNFTAEGKWSSSALQHNETLSNYLMRLIRVLQYKEIDIENVANRNAMAWFNKNKNIGMFPTDIINYSVKPQITILRKSDA